MPLNGFTDQKPENGGLEVWGMPGAAWTLLCRARLLGLVGTLVLAMGLGGLTSYAQGEEMLAGAAYSDDSSRPFYFTIPAPRGQILDMNGRPLARTKVVHRLMLRVPKLKEEEADLYVGWVDKSWEAIAQAYPAAAKPDVETLKQHFEHRRRLPIPISGVLNDYVEASPKTGPEEVEVQTEYARDYPGGTLAAHVVGYVSSPGAPLRGPLQYGEPLWRQVEGREGLEASMNAELAGQPGLLLVCYDKDGRLTKRHVMKAPVPGADIVTTIDSEIQAATEKALASAKRPGAMVVVDFSTGSILAMASAPTFDPRLFASGIDKEIFEKMKKDEDHPLFHRAIGALYPPGSVFKPFVALAGMKEGMINPYTRIPCGPELMIDGRKFRNWSDTDQGWFDLNSAIVRSCNTYFYQIGIHTGDQPILATARQFGFGQKIDLPLAGVATGTVPEKVSSAQGQANLSIGQSPILSSPLEVTMAMATLADGQRRPHARLVAQVQDQKGAITSMIEPKWDENLGYSPDHLVTVRDAMFSVVNHRNGTAPKARVKSLPVYGKTGTAQWSREGEMVNAVWFAGYVKDSAPPLAFAVALEGRKGERLFGGSAASPLAGQVLASIAASPKKYGVNVAKVNVPVQDYPLGNESQVPIPAYALTMGGDPLTENVYSYVNPLSSGGVVSPPVSVRSMVSASSLPGSSYTPSDVQSIREGYVDRGRYVDSGSYVDRGYSPRAFTPGREPESVRRAVPADPYTRANEGLPAIPPGYELRYDFPPPQRRARRILSFPR